MATVIWIYWSFSWYTFLSKMQVEFFGMKTEIFLVRLFNLSQYFDIFDKSKI